MESPHAFFGIALPFPCCSCSGCFMLLFTLFFGVGGLMAYLVVHH